MSRIFKVLLLSLSLLFSALLMPAYVAASDELVVGVFPRRPVLVSYDLFKPLAEKLEQSLGRPVRLVLPSTFPKFWQGVEEHQYDLVHFNQYHYLKSHQKYDYNAIVANQEFGSRTISGAIFVRKDSGIHELSDLKGKSIIFGGGPMAMGSFIGPHQLLSQAGLHKERDYAVKYAPNPPSALIGLATGDYDAAGAGDMVAKLPLLKNYFDLSSIRILAKTEPVTQLLWAASPSLSVQEQEQIQQLLVGLKESEVGRAVLNQARIDEFFVVNDSDYDSVRKIVRDSIGEDYFLKH